MSINQPHHIREVVEPGSVVADALRAESLLASDPDAAALALDGAMRALLDQIADIAPDAHLAPEALLQRLDEFAPDVARRFRLALRAPHVEARIAHLWALIDLVSGRAVPIAAAHAR